MKTLTFEMSNGNVKEFKLPQEEIDKILMSFDHGKMVWFVIKNYRVRPEHIISITVD